MYIHHNQNPDKKRTIDCVIRAVSFALNEDWETTLVGIMVECIKQHDMPEVNSVWAAYLRNHGFKRALVPDTCPICYTVRDFCMDHPTGTFILVITGYGVEGGHVVAVRDGDYYDIWDSGGEVPSYYWERIS